jgi:integrase
MASVFKPKGSDKYVILYRDENRQRRKKVGTHDKAVTKRIANELENKVALRKAGLIDPREEAYSEHAAEALLAHVDAWTKTLRASGATPQHVKMHTSRTMRTIALIKGAKLADIEAPKPATRKGVAKALADLRARVESARIADLTADNVQKALARLTAEGRSLQTAEHHRNAVKSFSKWMHETGRTRDYDLRRVKGFNIREDVRHERRTIALDELQRLIDAAHVGKPYKSMMGPMRALCYRLAVASGLRYSEIGSIKPESFNWDECTVTIQAAYAKNGQTAALPIPPDLAADLKPYVATKAPGERIFPLPHDKGAAMLRVDLKTAKVPYRDAARRVFDFHSLRCELATLADAAGVSPRVVQRMMRHSKLEMTGRYTRPRAMDLERAATMVPSLKPAAREREAMAATGTDGKPARDSRATAGATGENDESPNIVRIHDVTANSMQKVNPLVEGSSPSPVNELKSPEVLRKTRENRRRCPPVLRN